MILAFLKFLLKSKNEHSLHSPFVFELYTKVIKDKTQHPAYAEVEALRKTLLKSDKTIKVVDDFGAGSRTNVDNLRKVRTIAKNSAERAKVGKLLHRLVAHFQPDCLFDLGTSLGITTLYMWKGHQNAKLYTFEGSSNIAKKAQENFDGFGLDCQPILGNIDDTLPKTLDTIEKLDFVFFDANHRYEPTMRYFKNCLPKVHTDTVFVFDDIYWSKEMTKAWEEIKDHPDVLLTIDLFYIGLVFFRDKQPKQHFILRP